MLDQEASEPIRQLNFFIRHYNARRACSRQCSTARPKGRRVLCQEGMGYSTGQSITDIFQTYIQDNLEQQFLLMWIVMQVGAYNRTILMDYVSQICCSDPVFCKIPRASPSCCRNTRLCHRRYSTWVAYTCCSWLATGYTSFHACVLIYLPLGQHLQ